MLSPEEKLAIGLRPKLALAEAGRRWPQAWAQFDVFRAGRGKDLPVWPEWCFCPMAAAYAILSAYRGYRSDTAQCGILAALAAWRVTQGVYVFDTDVFDAVWDTPLNSDIPADILYRLPEWCVYVATPGRTALDHPLNGFFAHMEWDANTGRTELRLVLDIGHDAPPRSALSDCLIPIPLHIGSDSILSAVERSLRTSQRRADEQGVPFDADSLISPITATVTPLVSLLLYLCSEAAEIGDGTRAPAYPSPVITRKHGPRLFPPDRATTWDVGVRLGAALRQARQAESNGSGPGAGTVRPHVRRAHWHTYRVGAGRQGRALRWINPILVGTTSADGLVPVVRDVT